MVWVLVCLETGGFACVPEMNNPYISWQCGGGWEGLLASLWCCGSLWAGCECSLPYLPIPGGNTPSRLSFSPPLLEAGLIYSRLVRRSCCIHGNCKRVLQKHTCLRSVNLHMRAQVGADFLAEQASCDEIGAASFCFLQAERSGYVLLPQDRSFVPKQKVFGLVLFLSE